MERVHLLSVDELGDALRVAVPRATTGTIRLRGRDLPYVPPSVGQYLRFTVARFDAPKAFYVMMAQVEAAELAIQQAVDKGIEPSPEDLRTVHESMRAGTRDYLSANATDQLEADCSVIATALGHPGNVKVEEWLAEIDDEELEPALAKVERDMHGKDPLRFFGVVARKVRGRTEYQVMKALAAKEASASSSRTTSTKTRKPSSDAPPPKKSGPKPAIRRKTTSS